MVLHMLREYTDMKDTLAQSRKLEDAFIMIFMKMLCISSACSEEMFYYNASTSTLHSFGTALLPFRSRINHSCSPNTNLFMNNNVTHIFTVVPIKAGEEVTISSE